MDKRVKDSISDREIDEWMESLGKDGVRKAIREWHLLRQGLCYQVLHVPTGADDWVTRAIHAAERAKRCESEVRKLIQKTETAAAEARDAVRDTTCTNCMGRGQVGDDACCICRGTGRRTF